MVTVCAPLLLIVVNDIMEKKMMAVGLSMLIIQFWSQNQEEKEGDGYGS
jgi:hypothetical protein